MLKKKIQARKGARKNPRFQRFQTQPDDRLSLMIIHIKATFNNTFMTLTNSQGQVLTWCSAGSSGFKGSRKGTPFAAKRVVEIFMKKSNDYFHKCHHIIVCIQGTGPGRQNAIRGLIKMRKIRLLRDLTKIPHNGCRPPKKRRL